MRSSFLLTTSKSLSLDVSERQKPTVRIELSYGQNMKTTNGDSTLDQTISVHCPACGQEFPLSEAVLGSVRHGLEKELQVEIEHREKNLADKRRALGEQQAALTRKAAALDEQVEGLVKQRLEQQVDEIKTKAAKRAAEAQETILKELREDLSEKAAALKKAQDQELDLRREKRQLEEAKEALKLEVQRTLDEERGKLKERLRAAADEENRLKIAEKEKVISDLKTKLDEAQRRAAQGSQQTQGEVLELDFEQQLRQAFPVDQISEISKGVRGADVVHEVRGNTGRSCGVILYETKRTQNWSDGWIAKLKEDMRSVKAEIGVIVTEVLPKGIARFGHHDGVWVCDLVSAIPLVHVLRCTLQELAIARGHQEGAKEKMQVLYIYLTGIEFRQRVSAVIEAFTAMRQDLERERRAITKSWSKREKHINAVVENMAGMIGDMQAISGNALKEIPPLELEMVAMEDENE